MQTVYPLLILCLACLSAWFFIYGVFTIHSSVLAHLRITPVYPAVVLDEHSATYFTTSFLLSRDTSTEEQFSPVLDQNIADNPLYTEQVNKISIETPTTVIPTQKWTLVMVNRTHSSFSSQTAITEPYWNQTSFYMNLGQFYEQQPLYLHLSNHLNSFSSRSQCLQCGSHYPLLTSILADELEWNYRFYYFNDSW